MSSEQLVITRNIAGTAPRVPIEIEPGTQCRLTDLVEQTITPGDLKAPPYVICHMRRLPNGDYRPEPVEWSGWVQIADSGLKKLGLNISRQTLHRLWKNGYVVARQISPAIIELNLASFIEHLNRVDNDPYFWSSKSENHPGLTRREAFSRQIY